MKKLFIGGLVVFLLMGLVLAAQAQYKPVWEPNGKYVIPIDFEGVSGFTPLGDSLVTLNQQQGQTLTFIRKWDENLGTVLWTMPFVGTGEARGVAMGVTSNDDVIIAFTDLTQGPDDIYARTYDGATGMQSSWVAQISSTPVLERNSRIVPDESGGAYIVYKNDDNKIIYINHMDANGSTWASSVSLFSIADQKGAVVTGTDGKAVVVAASGEAVYAALVNDNNGAANIEALTRVGPGNWYDVEVSGNHIFTVVASPGADGTTARLGELYLYKLNKSDLTRDTSFGNNGVVKIGDSPYSGVPAAAAFIPQMIVDSNGYLYICWHDTREGNIWTDLYISKVDPGNGNELWTTNATNAPGVQSFVWPPEIVASPIMAIDETTGKLGLIWQDFRTDKNTYNIWSNITFDLNGDIFMQIINMGDGSMLNEPVVLCSYPSLEVLPSLYSLPSSSYFFTVWADLRYKTPTNQRMDLFGQKVEYLPTQITGAATVPGSSDLIAVAGQFGADPTVFYNNDFANEEYSKAEVNGSKREIVSWATDEVVVRILGGVIPNTNYDIVITAYSQASNTWDFLEGATRDEDADPQLPQVKNLQGAGTSITFNFIQPVGVSASTPQRMRLLIIGPSGNPISIQQDVSIGHNEIRLSREIFSTTGLYIIKLYYGDTYIDKIAISYMGR